MKDGKNLASPPTHYDGSIIAGEEAVKPAMGNSSGNSWPILLKEPWRLRFGWWELWRLWHEVPLTGYDIGTWEKRSCYATYGRLLGRFVLIGRGKPHRFDYMWRIGRFGWLSANEWKNSPYAASIWRWMSDFRMAPSAHLILSKSTSVSGHRLVTAPKFGELGLNTRFTPEGVNSSLPKLSVPRR